MVHIDITKKKKHNSDANHIKGMGHTVPPFSKRSVLTAVCLSILMSAS